MSCLWFHEAGCGTGGVPPPGAPGGMVCPSSNYGGWCSAAATAFRTNVWPTCVAPPPPPPPPSGPCNGWVCIQSKADAAPNWVATRPGKVPRRRSNYNGIQCWGPNALTSPCGWFASQHECNAATCSAAGAGPGGEYCSESSLANPNSWCGAAKAAWGM